MCHTIGLCHCIEGFYFAEKRREERKRKQKPVRNPKKEGGESSNLDASGASVMTYKSAIKHQRPERERFLSLPSICASLHCCKLFVFFVLSLLLSFLSLGQQNRVVELCCHPLSVWCESILWGAERLPWPTWVSTLLAFLRLWHAETHAGKCIHRIGYSPPGLYYIYMWGSAPIKKKLTQKHTYAWTSLRGSTGVYLPLCLFIYIPISQTVYPSINLSI